MFIFSPKIKPTTVISIDSLTIRQPSHACSPVPTHDKSFTGVVRPLAHGLHVVATVPVAVVEEVEATPPVPLPGVGPDHGADVGQAVRRGFPRQVVEDVADDLSRHVRQR